MGVSGCQVLAGEIPRSMPDDAACSFDVIGFVNEKISRDKPVDSS
jgi:hypothetical protein